MMDAPVLIRKSGKGGHITLNRPKALNALSWDMCLTIERALDEWAQDDEVSLIVIDANGDRAFCAGGDITDIYQSGLDKDFAYGQKFWSDEYRLNAKLANYPKPIVSFMQGFVMGGGVGVACHVAHRIVGDTTQLAMPECGIGLVPDVGGTFILANAPGHIGKYFGLTGSRMTAGDAIYCGFADTYVPEADWDDLKLALLNTGDPSLIPANKGMAVIAEHATEIDRHFSGATLTDIIKSLETASDDLSVKTLKALRRNSPLAMACALELQTKWQSGGRIEDALELEYRFTARALEHGDFLEGIRAAVIDKDRNPVWQNTLANDIAQKTAFMLSPLGEDTLNLEEPS
ncbi:MAG: enoyl-CoA hydratase/isomerase family protein [Pseudomonadota bacterium]|nr:enoyl-CoA hydratase/isomerase family protein [Pseudomonadota bacterium]